MFTYGTGISQGTSELVVIRSVKWVLEIFETKDEVRYVTVADGKEYSAVILSLFV
jgi:hypothetical protein